MKTIFLLKNRLLPIMMFLLLGVVQMNAQTEKVYTFDNASGWTNKGNIVVTPSGTTSSSTMTCLSTSSATYPNFGTSGTVYSFQLTSADSVITKVEYIYRFNDAAATIPIFFGKAAPTIASSVATFSGIASGGFSTGVTTGLNTNAGNCPGENLIFAKTDEIKYVGFTRLASTMPAHNAGIMYDNFSIRLTSTSGSYTVSHGLGSSVYLGQFKITVAPLSSSTDPTFTVPTTPITGLDYVAGSGPSTAQSFTFTGSNLTGGNIGINAPSNFEVSLDGFDFGAYKEIAGVPAEDLAAQTIYVRLVAGLSSSATAYSGNISISGAGVTTPVTYACSGTVSASGAEPTIQLTSAAATTNQTIMLGSAISAITYTFAAPANAFVINWGATGDGGLSVSDLGTSPLTIFGTPSAEGTYTYEIKSTDGSAFSEVLSGTIAVKALVPVTAITWTQVSLPTGSYTGATSVFSSDNTLRALGGSGTVRVDANSIRFNNSGSATTCNLAFKTTGTSIITVRAASTGSGSTNNRTLGISSNGTEFGTFSAPETGTLAATTSVYYNGTNQDIIYLYSKGSAIDVTSINVAPAAKLTVTIPTNGTIDITGATTVTNVTNTAAEEYYIYPVDDSAGLTANPASNYTFKEWTGDLSGTTNPETLVMDADKTVGADFQFATGIGSLSASKVISSVKYYTITGIEANANTTGILIAKTFYTDGSVKVTKIVK